MTWLRRVLIAGLGVTVIANLLLVSHLLLDWPTFAPAHPKLDYVHTGVQPGMPMRAFSVSDLDGETRGLDDSWTGKPTLLVTVSYTCPMSRANLPGLVQIQERFGERLHVQAVYVVEAHPTGSASPYSEDVWITPQNEDAAILYPQPTTIAQRCDLARAFAETATQPLEVVVDDMDNFLWGYLGRAPNMAVLIDADGQVVARQGWFAPTAMETEIAALLGDAQ